MESLRQDLRYAWRMLTGRPAFSLIVVFTLALGIGANTAIFSVVEALLLRPLPFQEPDRLVMIWEHNRPRNRPRNVVGPANFLKWRDRSQSFDQMAAIASSSMNLTGAGEPERVPAAAVSPNLFSLLGVQAHLGRVFQEADGLPESERILLLSHGFWQRRFGSDSEIVGRSITIDGTPRTVVGVMPPEFDMPPGVDAWTQFVFTEEHRTLRGRFMLAIGRLGPGVQISQAQAEMAGIAASIEGENPDFNKGWGVNLVPLQEQLSGEYRLALLVLLSAVGVLLLIGCANVANLLLARATAREREIAVRCALGAGRGRLVRQLLTESAVLALIAGIVSLVIAYWSIEGLLAILPEELPRFIPVGLNFTVLSFALLVSILTGFVFGIFPALQGTRLDLQDALREGGRSSSDGARRGRVRSVLVGTEVGLAFVLLICAGLLLRSFAELNRVSPGFTPENVLTFRLTLPGTRYPEDHHKRQFFEQVLDRIRQMPGVEAAGGVTFLPLAGSGAATGFFVLDRPEPPAGEKPVGDIRFVQGDYFRAMGIPLLRGRMFEDRDHPSSPKRVLIDDTMARRFWPDEDPIGKRISMGWGENVEAEVIGVVGDVRLTSLDAPPRATLYWSHVQMPENFLALVVRSRSDPATLARSLRAQVTSLDPDLPVYGIRTLEEIAFRSMGRPRFNTFLLGVFSVLAMLLAAIGIYGVISYSVRQRTHEIGIRIALGAEPGSIVRLVVRQGILPALYGVAAGLILAWLVTGFLSEMLFNVSPTDPVTFAAVALGLLAVSGIACYIPARRATRVDPMIALRCE